MSVGPAGSALLLLITLVLGGLGAVLRALAVASSPRMGLHAANLVGTVTFVGVTAAASRGALALWVAVIVGAGFAGALTTFSGWMSLVAERAAEVGLPRAVALDAALPVLTAVGLTVGILAGP